MIHKPLLLSHEKAQSFSHHETDCDCACASELPFRPRTVGSGPGGALPDGDFVITPDLYVDEVDGHHLLFNPLGERGIAVVNDPGFHFLNHFRRPGSLAAAWRQFAGGAEVWSSISRELVELGLLVEANGRFSPPSPPQTLTAWLHVTNQCNLRCHYCYVHKTPDKMSRQRGRQAVDAVFRSAQAHQFQHVKLKYAGGEATLNFPLLLELHAYARAQAEQKGINLSGVVLSNGIHLSPAMIDDLARQHLKLAISLDGLHEYHDRQRPLVNQRGSFHLVQRTLQTLRQQQYKPTIVVTVSHQNLPGLPELIAYLLEMELPFSINFFRDNDSCHTGADLHYREAEMIATMKQVFRTIEKDLPPYNLLSILVDRANLQTGHQHPCGAGHAYLVVDQDGNISKCQMEIDRHITTVDAPDPLHAIRNSSIGVQAIPVNEKEGCRTCHWRYRCAGGCPLLTYRVTGRFDVKSPNCHIYQALFPDVLRLEAKRLIKYA